MNSMNTREALWQLIEKQSSLREVQMQWNLGCYRFFCVRLALSPGVVCVPLLTLFTVRFLVALGVAPVAATSSEE